MVGEIGHSLVVNALAANSQKLIYLSIYSEDIY